MNRLGETAILRLSFVALLPKMLLSRMRNGRQVVSPIFSQCCPLSLRRNSAHMPPFSPSEENSQRAASRVFTFFSMLYAHFEIKFRVHVVDFPNFCAYVDTKSC